MGSLFTKCAHVWGPVSGRFQPSSGRSFSATGMVALKDVLGLIYGETTLHQTCTRCPKTRTVRSPGKADLRHYAFSDTAPVARTRPFFRDCDHRWTPSTSSFSPPQGRSASLSGMISAGEIHCITDGVSTLTQFCEHCRAVHIVIQPGYVPGKLLIPA